MNRTTAALLVLSVFVSCSSFIKKEEIPLLREYEKGEYIMKQDVKHGEYTAVKGQTVKLLVVTASEHIKIYAYPADKEMLKADRVLIIYLFEEDFPGNKFNVKTLEEKLYGVVEQKVQQ
jgi:type II secretion system-associated lipoprotein